MAGEINYKEPLYSIYEGFGNLSLHKHTEKRSNGLIKVYCWLRLAGRREMLANYYNNLADCYEKSGDYNLAYNFIRNSASIRDSLLNDENLRQINEMNALYETSKKEATLLI